MKNCKVEAGSKLRTLHYPTRLRHSGGGCLAFVIYLEFEIKCASVCADPGLNHRQSLSRYVRLK
jgi:hypothetical protein